MTTLTKLGTANCQCCGWRVVVKQSKGGKAYYTCDSCGLQVFSRGPDSDSKLRAMMQPIEADPPPKPEPEPEPKRKATGGGNGWEI